MTMIIRDATVSDIPALLSLQATCPEAPQWSQSAWQDTLAPSANTTATRHAFCILDASSLAGCAVVAQTLDICEVESIAIGASFRRQGAASRLLRHAFTRAAHSGASRAQLEVRASNTAAQQLYASLGFVQDGARRHYYRDPAEDAVLLSATLPLPVRPVSAKV